jgi:hypothetical protein
MMAYDLRLQEKPETADFVIEGRVGVLANDGYEVTYGIPGNAAAASATALLPTPVPIPAPGMPELSLGRRNHQAGTAKVGLFAYDRITREPVWQAGVKRGASDMRDTWFLGLGPYHYRSPTKKDRRRSSESTEDPLAAYTSTTLFERAVQPRSEATPAAAQPAPLPTIGPASAAQPTSGSAAMSQPAPIPLKRSP